MKISKITLFLLVAAITGASSLRAQGAATPALSAGPATAAPAATSADAAAPVTPIPPRTVAATSGFSPHETVSAHIGAGRTAQLVTITYGRPYSKAPANSKPPVKPGDIRKVWGNLVPWDQVWRMGADEATTLITTAALDFGGVTVPAGAYTLEMVPSEKGITKLVFNKQIGQWGIPYTAAIQANELARVDMKKDTIKSSVDQFTIAVENTANATPPGGVIKAQWETTQYSIAFTVKP